MKTKILFAGIAAVLSTSSISAFAQQTSYATADAHAEVIKPVSIIWGQDLNFGNIAVGGAGGTTKIDVTSGAGVRSSTGEVSLPAGTTATPASFTVSGEANYEYTISITPATVTMNNITNPGSTMTVDHLHSYPASPGRITLTGTQTLIVGGTLTAGPSQPKGVYSSATPVTVTVSYQ